jgi:hypothetical protein
LPIYGKFMIKWTEDIGNYCNILQIFPIFLLAIFYCPFGKFKLRHRPPWGLSQGMLKISKRIF